MPYSYTISTRSDGSSISIETPNNWMVLDTEFVQGFSVHPGVTIIEGSDETDNKTFILYRRRSTDGVTVVTLLGLWNGGQDDVWSFLTANAVRQIVAEYDIKRIIEAHP